MNWTASTGATSYNIYRSTASGGETLLQSGVTTTSFTNTGGHRIRLHYLPKYAPETNPIERIWWRLHETITRNHRCQTIDDLLHTIYTWVDTQWCFFTNTLAEYAIAA